MGTGNVVGLAVLAFEFHKEGRLWVGECRELGTATDGRSLEKVEQELGRLVLLHLNGLEQIGERERVFEERGIKLYTPDRPLREVERIVPVTDQPTTLLQFKTVPISAPLAEPVGV